MPPDRPGEAALRGPAATGLLLIAILLFLTLSPAPAGPRLAAVGVAAVLFRAVFAVGALRRALQEFAEPLDLLLELAFVITAMALTGGIRSAFALLLFLNLLLARACLGPAASRFLALVTLLGLGALAGAGPVPLGEGALLGLIARVLWPLPVLLAMEVSLSRPPAVLPERRAIPAPAPPVDAPAPPPVPAAPSGLRAGAWSAIAHDLKSPLSVIRVYADLIAEQAQRGEPARADHIRNLTSEIELMETLLGSVAPPVEAGRGGWPARTDLVSALGMLAESYRLAHGDRLRVEFVAERPEVPVSADPVVLQRVFRNLLDNAVKFTPPGGRVRVRVGAEGGQGLVTVSDTGVGMSPEEQTRAFEYSFRGQAARGVEGRGLGLGVSRELVERSGGSISIASDPGQGSDVIVRLPLLRDGRP